MSLIKKLWFAIALLMLFVFGGSLLVSSLAAKSYLEEQLYLKNFDNAGSLASTLSQLPKDPVTIELLIAAQFDTGHYNSIELVDPSGEVIVVKQSETGVDSAPEWFVSLLPISAEPGVAQVQDGWAQYGTLTVASHDKFAYRQLWQSTLQLSSWFVLAAIFAALIGTLLLKAILRPLSAVVAQAEAIGDRRFVTTPVPGTAEFRTLVASMNTLADRVRQMLEEESGRLEELRWAAQHDELTGMLNREHFVARVKSMLSREDESGRGILLISRILDLGEMNRHIGWKDTDVILKRFTEAMHRTVESRGEFVSGRLNGSDFAMLIVGADDENRIGHQLIDSMETIIKELNLNTSCHVSIGITAYLSGESVSAVLGRTDAALAAAVATGGSAVQSISGGQLADGGAVEPEQHLNSIQAALEQKAVRLHSYPVVDREGALIHRECVARLRLSPGGSWMTAGSFMPWLARVGYSAKLDELVIELAGEQLRTGESDLAINLSAHSLTDPQLLEQLYEELLSLDTSSGKLWLEVPEHGVFRHLQEFRQLCAKLKPLGCRVGIEHAGYEISKIGLLHDLGLDYIKVDGSFIHEIDKNQSNQVYLRGLVMIAHSIGCQVIAESVQQQEEFDALNALGFDGATGPAVED